MSRLKFGMMVTSSFSARNSTSAASMVGPAASPGLAAAASGPSASGRTRYSRRFPATEQCPATGRKKPRPAYRNAAFSAGRRKAGTADATSPRIGEPERGCERTPPLSWAGPAPSRVPARPSRGPARLAPPAHLHLVQPLASLHLPRAPARQHRESNCGWASGPGVYACNWLRRDLATQTRPRAAAERAKALFPL